MWVDNETGTDFLNPNAYQELMKAVTACKNGKPAKLSEREAGLKEDRAVALQPSGPP